MSDALEYLRELAATSGSLELAECLRELEAARAWDDELGKGKGLFPALDVYRAARKESEGGV